jgi:DNA-binding LacI/PurR family transcriptional regulator
MTQRTNQVSMHDVALEAQVSSQTVSRVANGSGLVKPQTTEKVLAAMQKLGYRPNFAARALKRGRFNTIGVVMFDILATGDILTLEGITRAAKDSGYATTITLMEDEPSATLAATIERMKTLPVDGIVVVLEKMLPDVSTYVPPADLPVILISSASAPFMSTIDEDQHDCSAQAVNYLLERGHTNVYFIGGAPDSVAAQEREIGWRAALRGNGITPPSPLRGDWTADSGYDAGLALADIDECTAVYASNDAMANGAIQALRDKGRRVPDDVSVIGVDNSLQGMVARISLTTVSLDFAAVGRTAFTMAKRAIESETPIEPTHTLIPGTLIERSSVARLR